MTKYHARPTRVDGIRFDSQAEAARYRELRLLEAGGQISELIVHPVFLLQAAFRRDGHTFRAISYEADFQYQENGVRVAEDIKGVMTDVFRIKWKLFLKQYPNIELRIIKV